MLWLWLLGNVDNELTAMQVVAGNVELTGLFFSAFYRTDIFSSSVFYWKETDEFLVMVLMKHALLQNNYQQLRGAIKPS